MFYVIQDSDGPFITEDKSVMEKGDKLLGESEDKEIAQLALRRALEVWMNHSPDDGPEEFWRDYA